MAVGICDVNDEVAAAVAGELDRAFAITADLTDPSQCRSSVDAVISRCGRIDVIVNNAGAQKVAPLSDFPETEWDKLVALILSAPFHIVKRATPAMYEAGYGRIVNLTSMLGQVGEPFKAAYVSAKHGVNGLTKVVALEGASHGVTCNAVCPAYVRTPWLDRSADELAASHEMSREEVEEKILLKEPAIKRLAEPGEVADLVVYLCSEGAGFITGSEYRIDGGYGAR